MSATDSELKSGKRSTTGTRVRVGLLSILGGIAFGLFIWILSEDWFQQFLEGLDPWLVVAIVALAPLAGTPVGLLFITLGAKFGLLEGSLICSACIVFHTLAGYFIGRSWLRRPIERLAKRLGYKVPQIPEGEHIPILVLLSLVPGAPYSARLYLLVLTGTPLWHLLLAYVPINVVRASIGIFAGHMAREMTVAKASFLVVYSLLLVGMSYYVVRRLRAIRRRRREAESGAAS